MSESTRKSITANERLILIGLVSAAVHPTALLNQLVLTASQIAGEPGADGSRLFDSHFADAIWSDVRPGCDPVAIVDEKLRNLHLIVEPE